MLNKIIKLKLNEESCYIYFKLKSNIHFDGINFHLNKNNILSYIQLFFDKNGDHIAGELSFSDKDFILQGKKIMRHWLNLTYLKI